jgi:hypothetical protein
MSFMKSFRGFTRKMLVEMLIRKRWKTGCRIVVVEEESFVRLFPWMIICMVSRTQKL